MSMAPKLRVKELIIGIQQDCGRYADLQQLLLNQHSLLASHDVDGLTGHNRQQTRLMADIQHRTNSTDACWPARSKRSTPCWARSHPMAGRNTSPIESSAPLQGAMTQAGELVQLPLLP